MLGNAPFIVVNASGKDVYGISPKLFHGLFDAAKLRENGRFCKIYQSHCNRSGNIYPKASDHVGEGQRNGRRFLDRSDNAIRFPSIDPLLRCFCIVLRAIQDRDGGRCFLANLFKKETGIPQTERTFVEPLGDGQPNPSITLAIQMAVA